MSVMSPMLTTSLSSTMMPKTAAFRPATQMPRGLRCPSRSIRAQASGEEKKSWIDRLAVPSAALLGAALLLTATPDAAEAARSGGRVGGSSFSSRRAAPAPSRPSPGPSRQYNSYNTYVAPPLGGGIGMGMPFFGGGYGMPFYGGGIGVFPSFGISGIFNIFLIFMLANVAISVIRNFTNGNGGNNNSKGDEDSWDDKW